MHGLIAFVFMTLPGWGAWVSLWLILILFMSQLSMSQTLRVLLNWLLFVELDHLFVKFINVRHVSLINLSSVVLAFFVSLLPFFLRMIESANLRLIASWSIAKDSFILVRMVKSFDSCMALVAFKPVFALVPPNSFNESLTILWQIFENVRWSSEVSHVMSVDTTLWIMGIFLVWTPTTLIFEHVEGKSFNRSFFVHLF